MAALTPRHWPVRVRLVAAFVIVMVVVLSAAGAFVFWRVEVALDRTLNEELAAQASTLQTTWRAHPGDPTAVVAALPADALAQVLSSSGAVLASTLAAARLTLLPSQDLGAAAHGLIDLEPGNLLTGGKKRLRSVALNLPTTDDRPVIAVTAVRLGQRDEALRELLAQLAIANLGALALAAAVGYRLTRATLFPVERYRLRAEQITEGASGVRLEVPDDVNDEISRLGHTLNQMLSAQERAVEQQRQFIADASHELRTPLTVLTTEVELALRRPRTAEEYQQTLTQVAIDTARLVALADQLLDLEQSHAGPATRPAATPPTDVTAALHRAATRSRARLGPSAREVAVLEPRGQAASVTIAVPEAELEQILGNLVDNASIHGQGTISIGAQTHDGWLLLTVHDDGDGPPAEFVAHAIERFRRADSARTTPGNGLGLALVHSLVNQAGGELRLCTPAEHYRYPPLVDGAPACDHPAPGTTVSALLRVAQPG